MNWKEYKEYAKKCNYERIGCTPPVVIMFLVVLLLFSCKSIQYVPVETVRTEYKTKTDTVKVSDTIRTEKETILREARTEDSAMIAKLGIKLQDNERLLILLRNHLTESNSKQYESHTDTIIKTDSIQVPYPVEKKLTKWQQFKMDFSEWIIGIILIFSLLFCIYLARRKVCRTD